MSSNLSTGVVALLEILKMASPTLQKLGYTPVLVETHHSHKKDAPSGTALAMAKCIVSDSGDRPAQIHSIRAGEVIGDHNMTFYGPSDSITISHHAQDRSSFARGALDISAWLVSKKAKDPTLTGFLGTDAYLRDLLGGR
jgi:4-hydroxy-tetrahydrodipicolinate reductase